jgi:hypothetical protein
VEAFLVDNQQSRKYSTAKLRRAKVPDHAVHEEKDTRVPQFGPNLERAVTQEVEEDVQHEAPPGLQLDKM